MDRQEQESLTKKLQAQELNLAEVTQEGFVEYTRALMAAKSNQVTMRSEQMCGGCNKPIKKGSQAIIVQVVHAYGRSFAFFCSEQHRKDAETRLAQYL